ncbi:MAG TPA: hypothetical protein DDZ89_04105 [Clostridiales bacterium]|jgi:hypothetical protein|nr:hypothetical protein [Clostridiales bacterium]
MTGKDLYDAMNSIEDNFIREADEAVPLKKGVFNLNRKRFTGIAACIVLVVCAFVIMTKFLPNLTSSKEPHQGEAATAIQNDYVKIYYLENGTTKIKEESVKLDYTPQKIFQEWKKLNSIPNNVNLVDYKIESNGYEKAGSSGTTGYVVGDVFTLNVTLSDEFMTCLNQNNRTALIESLEKTLSYQKINFKSINIIVGGQKVNN